MRKRDNTVAEMRMGSMSLTPEYACDKEYFNSSLPLHTIVGKINMKKTRVQMLQTIFYFQVESPLNVHFLVCFLCP